MQTIKIQMFFVVSFAFVNLGLANAFAPNPQPKIKGNFTVIGKSESVWLIPPKIDSTHIGCIGACAVVLQFSDPKTPTIKVNGSIDGTLYNLGDLNNDGKDEIGILHQWFNGCWNAFDVYTFKYGKWELAVPPISTHCNQWEANLKPIVKDPAKSGFVKITYSVFENNDIVFKTKSVAVK